MSDEEKKAIEEFKKLKDYKHTYYGYTWFKVEVCADDEMKQNIDIILNLIEKQQKEIEELKEDNKELKKYYATRKEVEELKEINECLHDSADNYVHTDKIKAKVIEVKNRNVKDEFITASQGKLNTIIDIESLLEKENNND